MIINICTKNLIRSVLSCKRCAGAQMILSRGFLYSSKTGVSRDLIAYLTQPIDLRPVSIKNWYIRKQWEMHKENHRYISERHETLGADLATAHFVVARDGAVKFVGQSNWIEKNKDGSYSLPRKRVENIYIEAIDASHTEMIYCSFDNFVDLKYLKYLNLSRCPYIDDWCLDRLSGELCDTLEVLDLSGCPQVTDRGLGVLLRLKKLKRLVLADMPSIQNVELAALLLEEGLPGCVVDGVNYTQLETTQPEEHAITPLMSHIQYLRNFVTTKLERENS